MSQKKRRRPVHLHVMVSEEELALIRERMAEAGIRNMGAYMRKMALNGYVLHVDLSPVQELVSLQRRCSNNLNQVAIQANTYGGIYPEEIKALQRDYETLWEPLSDLLKKVANAMRLTVQDNGIGISQENLDKIWQRVYQADPSRQENAGLGLGLSMVQQIVTLHGGTVAVTSAPGHGTTFTVTLPEHHGKEES